MTISQSNLQSCHTFCIRTQRKVVGNMYGNIFSSSPLKSPVTGLQHVTCSNYFFSKFVTFPKCLWGFHLHSKETSRLSHTRSCLCYSLWIASDPHIHIFIQAQSTSKMLNITRETCHTLQKDLRLVFQVCILTSKDYKTVCIKHKRWSRTWKSELSQSSWLLKILTSASFW